MPTAGMSRWSSASSRRRPCRRARRPSWCGTGARRAGRPTARSPRGAPGGCAAWRRGRRRGRPCGRRRARAARPATVVGEAVPGHVRLRSVEQEDVVVGGVATDGQLGTRPHEPAADAVAQLEHRPPGAVVDEHVVVEVDERRGRALLVQRRHRRGGGAAGVDPPRQHHHQHRIMKIRDVADEVMVGHSSRTRLATAPPGVSAALRTASSTWRAKGASSAGSRRPRAPPR